jgi:hypothetical protein
MAQNDQDLDAGQAAAIAGREPPNNEWTKHVDLAGSLTGGKSGNYVPLARATALLEYERQHVPLGDPRYEAAIQDWIGYYAASREQYMGDEWDSVIYSHRHVIPNTAVAAWTLRNFPDNPGALDWLAAFFQLARLISTPAGYWCGFGQRSGGHPTRPSAERATISYLLAVASGDAARETRALAWAHTAGAAPGQNWAFAAVDTLRGTLQLAWQRSLSGTPLADVKFAIPMSRLANAKGEFIAWIVRADGTCSDNSNTPVVPAVVWTEAQADSYAPANGGNHFRELAERCTIQRVGDELQYASDRNAPAVLRIPDSCGAIEVYGT